MDRRPSYACPVINKPNKKILESNTSPKLVRTESTKNKEKLFRRRDEGYNSYSRSRQIRRRNANDNLNQKNSAGGLTEKERSSSMSRILDGYVINDLYYNINITPVYLNLIVCPQQVMVMIYQEHDHFV